MSAADSNKDQTSTLQSYVDQATGAVQSALGSLTGNTADKVCSSGWNVMPQLLTHFRHKVKIARSPQTRKRTSPTQPPKLDLIQSLPLVVSLRTTTIDPLDPTTSL
jgi:hypothetical protein